MTSQCGDDPQTKERLAHFVDATASHALLSFADAYSRYNQIFMHSDDQAHTSFITDHGLYCYKVPKTVNDIQSLIGRVTSLTKATDRCAPFFKALKGNK
ncbi:unnamed protein product [Prunus armeniaca]